MWALERLDKLDDETLARASSSKEKEVRVHAQRILTEKKAWSPKDDAMAILGLADKDALVQRVAVEALAAHPAVNHVQAIVSLRHAIPANDTHLLYATRLALREQLRSKDAWNQLLTGNPWPEIDRRAVADVCLGVHNEPSAAFLKTYLSEINESIERTRDYTRYVVRYGADDPAQWALDFAKVKHAKNLAYQGAVLKAVVQASQERGSKLTDAERTATALIVEDLLKTNQPGEQQVGAEIAGSLKLAKTQPQLLALIAKEKLPEAVRKTCITSLVNIDAKQAVPPLTQLLLNEKEAIAIREQVANALAGINHPEAHAALVQALQNAPARLQSTIALGMAGTSQGGDKLLQAIEAGKASPRLLQDRAIELRLQQVKVANVKARLAKLTQGLPAGDQKTQELITKRRDAFTSFQGDPLMGQKIFQKHCANCHQIATQGAKIGPQLDGIGNRGLERLLEDVLDPNRNVDQAFRTTVITTKAGKIESGLFLREEGNVVILADAQGKDVRIEKAQIEERSFSPLSPMPSNIAELISEPEFHHLMAYLLSQRGKQ
jgi:putative heme-binding domain-containing protein